MKDWQHTCMHPGQMGRQGLGRGEFWVVLKKECWAGGAREFEEGRVLRGEGGRGSRG